MAFPPLHISPEPTSGIKKQKQNYMVATVKLYGSWEFLLLKIVFPSIKFEVKKSGNWANEVVQSVKADGMQA